jgi:dTMP kinase
MQGKLIVLEGMDAAGKATQAKLLLKRLRSAGRKAELISFPRYGSFFGKMIKAYLDGKLMGKADPASVALLYALDRADAAPEIEAALRRGRIVVADRYSASNLAYQTARVNGRKEQECFFNWLEQIEGGLPKPDASFFLDVPIGVSQRLMHGRKRKRDEYEKNVAFLRKVRAIYLRMCKKNFVRINCVSGSRMRSRQEIHQLLWENAQRYL